MSRLLFIVFLSMCLQSCFRIPTSAEIGKSISIEKYAKMPSIAQECSGMILLDDGLLFLNDGGNDASLFLLSKNGLDSLDRFDIEGTQNRDWEALTLMGDEIIVGDFGNNLGVRKDLKIYHIDLKTKKLNKTVDFSYPDQISFDDPKHNFDCEAIVIEDDSYLLFSKNRGDSNSNIYKSKIGSGKFTFQDSISLKGMVTDAIYHEASDSYLLLCYQFGFGGFKNSLAIVKKQANNGYKTTNVFNIGPPEQFEAITHLKDNEFLIGSEFGLGNGRHLYLVTIEGL